MKYSETRVDPKTGQPNKETYTRVPAGTPLEFPPGATAGPNTFVSDKKDTKVLPDGSKKEVPKYKELKL